MTGTHHDAVLAPPPPGNSVNDGSYFAAGQLARREGVRLAVAAAALPGRCATQIVRYELPQRAAQRAALDPAALARQARALGLRTPAEGAALPVWLTDTEQLPAKPPVSLWLDPNVPAPLLPVAWREPAIASALWETSEALVAPFMS